MGLYEHVVLHPCKVILVVEVVDVGEVPVLGVVVAVVLLVQAGTALPQTAAQLVRNAVQHSVQMLQANGVDHVERALSPIDKLDFFLLRVFSYRRGYMQSVSAPICFLRTVGFKRSFLLGSFSDGLVHKVGGAVEDRHVMGGAPDDRSVRESRGEWRRCWLAFRGAVRGMAGIHFQQPLRR